MTRSVLRFEESLHAAQPVIEHLRERIATERSILDVGDLSVIQTTVRTIEELLAIAAEYEDVYVVGWRRQAPG